MRPSPASTVSTALIAAAQAAGVPDHVGIGVVQHDQVVSAGVDGRDRLVGQFGRRHLGLQVVGRDLRRRHHDAILAGIGFLLAAVEEIGDVRIFLGLGHAQLRAPGGADHRAEHVRQIVGREDRLQEGVQMLAVLGHADRRRELHDAAARKAVECRVEHRPQNLAHAVGAEVEAKHAVAVANAAIAADHRRHHELVAEIVRIGIRDHRIGIGEARPFGVHDRAVGLGHAFPTFVAVHGVVPAADRRDRNRRRERLEQACDVVPCRARRRVTAVGKGVHDGGQICLRENCRDRGGVILVRMHAAGRCQPDEMAGAAGSPHAFDQALQRGRVGDLAARDRVVDARQILHHQPARADVEMADLGIAHLSRRQADVLSRRAQEGVRTARPQAIERGRARLPDGVVGGIVAPAPAVEYDQHHRTTLLHLNASCASPTPRVHRSGDLCGIAAASSTGGAAADRLRGSDDSDEASPAGRAFRVTAPRIPHAPQANRADAHNPQPRIG